MKRALTNSADVSFSHRLRPPNETERHGSNIQLFSKQMSVVRNVVTF